MHFNDCKNISLAPYNFTYSQLVQQSQEYLYDDKCWQKYENRGIYNLITLLDPAKFKRIVYWKIIGNIQEILFPYPMPQEYANSSVENAITEGDLIIEFIISYIEASIIQDTGKRFAFLGLAKSLAIGILILHWS